MGAQSLSSLPFGSRDMTRRYACMAGPTHSINGDYANHDSHVARNVAQTG